MDKQCSKCKEVKSIDNFYKHRTNKDGYWGYCKGCHYQYQKERRLKYPLPMPCNIFCLSIIRSGLKVTFLPNG